MNLEIETSYHLKSFFYTHSITKLIDPDIICLLSRIFETLNYSLSDISQTIYEIRYS